MTALTTIFVLLVVFQLKHFIADYPLQTPYMLKKFAPGREFILPLAAHAGVHAAFTIIIARIFLYAHPWGGVISLGLGLLDFVAHFAMDRVKASPALLGRYKALDARCYGAESFVVEDTAHGRLWDRLRIQAAQRIRANTYFWWALGFDQMFHHLTHYAIIAILVTQ